MEKEWNVESGRYSMPAVMLSDFEVSLYVIIPGRSYQIDYYVDFNLNGKYDAPPTDHAWRFETGKVNGDTSFTFEHDLNITDISFPPPSSLTDLIDDYSGKWINPTFSVEGDVEGNFFL